jgi:CobQ-like glutamine amidotransferase family enzyme
MELRIAHLYPEQLNIYGDRGNLLTLVQRCRWRNLQARVILLNPTDPVNPDLADIYLMGGGQDKQQLDVCDDLHRVKAQGLKEAAAQGAVFLGICGGYQLMGHYYKPHQGPELRGLSLMDAVTVAGNRRFIGNVLIERPDGSTVVGFENHSGLTRLGPGVPPLGRVLSGYGNNGEDGFEGAQVGNLYGTYLHGSLLPKNPALADELIVKALARRYGTVALAPLDNQLEQSAHEKVALKLK